MNWSRWNWLDDGVVPLAMAILRVCWLWPWLALLQRWLASSYQGTLLPLGLVFGLLMGGTVTARRALTLPSRAARMVVAGAGLLVIFLALWWQLYRPQYPLWNLRWIGEWGTDTTDWGDWQAKGIPPAFFALLAMAGLWLRGLLEGGRLSLMREHVWQVFVVGFGALAVLLLVARLDARGLPKGTSDLLWLFFATGMVTLALTGLKVGGGLEAGAAIQEEEVEGRPSFDRYWMGSVVSVIGGLLGLGLLLSALIAPEAVTQVLGAVWAVVRQVIVYLWMLVSLILYPIAYLIALALVPLLDAVARLGAGQSVESGRREPLRPEELPEGGGASFLDRLPPELRWFALVVLIGLIGLLFALALRRLLFGSKTKNGIEETRELVLSRDLLHEQLARLWRSWLDRLRRETKVAFSPFLALDGEPHTRRAIRAVYQALLATAKGHGHPRPRGHTPIEYRKGLDLFWPDSREALDVITDGYMVARYADDLPTVAQAQRVQEAWTSLDASLMGQESHETGAEV